MSKFYVPSLYNKQLADEGQWFSVEDTEGTLYGEFKLKYIDAMSEAGQLAYKRVRQRYAADVRAKKLTNYDALKVILVELHLLDWKLPTDPNDPKAKPVPFSKADAMEYFGMEETKWIAHKLSEYCSEPTNFKGGEQPSPEEISGN